MRAFADRTEAGREVAKLLGSYRGADAIVLGLPRGGVPVAAEVAAALALPLDVLLVRKLGHPDQRELAIGAVGEDGTVVWNHDYLDDPRISEGYRDRILSEERAELESRARLYGRVGRAPVRLEGRTAIVVDDGIATGSTARAAVAVARAAGAARVVLATPVIAAQTRDELGQLVDELVAVLAPDDFAAVGSFYRDFSPTEDAEVTQLLARFGAGPELDAPTV